MPQVAFAGTFAASLAPQVRQRLGAGYDIVVDDEAGIVARLPGVDMLVTLAFNRDMGAAASRLKLVQVPGAGLDRIDRSALPVATWLANAYGHDTGIAEYIIGAMLATQRSFGRLDARLRTGAWDSQWATDAPPPPPWPELAGKTLCILGYGHIGQALARRARAFDMDVRALRRDVSGGADAALSFLGGPASLPELLACADYLAVTLSLNQQTRGLLGAPELALMKPSSILINVARAEIIDEDALYRALAEGRIAGAALDVWWRYPAGAGPTFPSRQPFHTLPNVLMTPHVSGWTQGMLEARAAIIAENIRRVARGERPVNLIAPQAA
ncbi:2-hydroxyacid dehydrogenase [Vineibacter terrae]|uniref:2-hydroxyacid dehydrogenase n=1 Tax=Vineibacter terrae TaxID=2586908 RepID=UPI002E31AA64|nr:2-hydroxyacid dehydrogenase [Vineibacter terrae]HEX2891112.1 2-hydroxyacid dehydrogenase [Vineibacter terrae]